MIMLYETYERRIKKVYILKNKLYKYRVLLIAIAVAIILLWIGFTTTKGIIYDVSFPETIVYGEDMEVSANALFTDVEIEYSPFGKDEWTNKIPREPGLYQTKISSKQSFGRIKNEIYDFEINPKQIEININ